MALHRVLLRQTMAWIFHGRLSDTGREFFVQYDAAAAPTPASPALAALVGNDAAAKHWFGRGALLSGRRCDRAVLTRGARLGRHHGGNRNNYVIKLDMLPPYLPLRLAEKVRAHAAAAGWSLTWASRFFSSGAPSTCLKPCARRRWDPPRGTVRALSAIYWMDMVR